MTINRFLKLQIEIAAVLMMAVQLHGADVSISIRPQTFSTSEAAQLSVVAENGNFDERPNLPLPAGIAAQPYGQSRNVQIINGKMTQSVTQNFAITASQPGDYTIPSFEVKIDGQIIKTDQVSFRVTGSGNPLGNQTQPTQPGAAAPADGDTTGFLRLDFPDRGREHLYVGEMAPVRIKAYFPVHSQFSNLEPPRPLGQGFTLHNLSDQPDQNIEVYEGKRYQTLTWFAGLSMAKAGEYPVNVGLKATVMIPDKSKGGGRRRGSPFDSIFGGSGIFNDPFFDDFFDNAFTPTIPREVTLTSPGDPLTIKPLPTERRPENFSGAVGEFSLGGYRLPAEANTGEPQQIRITINGKGNFDRVNLPTLEPAEAWKTYKPKIDFTPGDAASFSGSKTFDFSAVPQKSGDQSLALSFSYFNPSKGEYVTVKSQSVDITVKGQDVKTTEELKSSVLPKASASSADIAKNSDAMKKPDSIMELAPLRPVTGLASEPLVSLIDSTKYWTFISISLFAMLAGFLYKVIQVRLNDPVKLADRHARHQEQMALHRATQAVQEQNVAAFLEAARHALQERFGRLWHRPAEAITLAELRERLPGDAGAIELFRQADAAAYAPQGQATKTRGSAAELQKWHQILQETLAETQKNQ